MTVAEKPISLREAARQIGIDVSVLSRQIKRGKVRRHVDGGVLLSEVLADRADMDQTGYQGGRRKKGGAQDGTASEALLDAGLVSFNEARRLKENYLALKQKQDYERESGKLVDADTVYKAVFAFFREDRDSLNNFPARVAPLIAAEIGCDSVALAVALEKYVREHLADTTDRQFRLAGVGAGGDGEGGREETGADVDGEPVGGPQSDTEPEGGERAGALAD